MPQEYLVSYGLLGDFGRFRAESPLNCQRGEAVVIRTSRGLEMGNVLSEATQNHVALLSGQRVGQLLRLADEEDRQTVDRMQQTAREIFNAAQEWALLQESFVEILDVEMLLDGRHVVLHCLLEGSCDASFTRTLTERFGVNVTLQDLTDPALKIEESPAQCGDCGSGGCGSCGSSGGCGTGCGSANQKEMQEYFAALREQMHRKQRVPLV